MRRGAHVPNLSLSSSQNRADSRVLLYLISGLNVKYLNDSLRSLEPSTQTQQASGNLGETAGKRDPFWGRFCFRCRAHPVRTRVGPRRARQNWVFHRTYTRPLQPDSALGVGFLKQIVFVYMHLRFSCAFVDV